MSSVNAVYLIVDTKTGDRYVGSTYGYDGLLGRWSVYVATGGHGNNKGMIQHLVPAEHSCHDLQFSVLQVLPKSLPDNQIIDTETLWKKKAADLRAVWHESKLRFKRKTQKRDAPQCVSLLGVEITYCFVKTRGKKSSIISAASAKSRTSPVSSVKVSLPFSRV